MLTVKWMRRSFFKVKREVNASRVEINESALWYVLCGLWTLDNAMHACIRLSFSHYYTFIILQLFETFAFFFHWLYLLYLFFIKKIIYLYKWEQRGKKALGKALCLLNIYFFSLLLLISFREKTNSNPIITFSLVNKCVLYLK